MRTPGIALLIVALVAAIALPPVREAAGTTGARVRADAPILSEDRIWLPAAARGDTAGGEWIWLDSEPFGAEVRLDAETLGFTPLWVNASLLEAHTIELSYPGYRRTTVGAGAARSRVVEITLDPIDSAREGGRGKRHPLLSRGALPYGLLLLGSGSAAAGVHFKHRADDAYEEYLHTGNDRKMREAFDRAERYDRWTLACWAVAEVSLVGILYLLMQPPEQDPWSVRAEIDGGRQRCGVKVGWEF